MKQIQFPPALINRFDLIFIIRDIPDKKRDLLLADHVLRDDTIDLRSEELTLSDDIMKKYFIYAKKIKPMVSAEANELIKNFYVNLRNAVASSEEEGAKPVPITPRQLQAIKRLSQAYARMKLSDIVRHVRPTSPHRQE